MRLLKIIGDYGLPPDISRPSGFASLVLIILEQQVSLDSARAVYNRLCTATDITPRAIGKLSIEEIRSCGITRQKSSYIKGMADLIISGDLDLNHLESLEVDQSYEILLQIKGVGPWTAQIYLMFCLNAPDLFPKGDIALNHSLRELFNLNPTEGQEHAKSWSPYRSHAAYLLWHHYLEKRNRKIP